MPHNMVIIAVTALSIGLYGCASSTATPPVYKLAMPAKHLMADPAPLPNIREGDSLYLKLAEQRADAAKYRRQIKGLLRYVKLIHKRQKGAP